MGSSGIMEPVMFKASAYMAYTNSPSSHLSEKYMYDDRSQGTSHRRAVLVKRGDNDDFYGGLISYLSCG